MDRRSFIGAATTLAAIGAASAAKAQTQALTSEQRHYADRAALLDPDCYEYFIGPTWFFQVPDGEAWYCLNMWDVNTYNNLHKLYHRDADIDDAMTLPPGSGWASGGPSGFMLVAKPSKVQSVDTRYTDDPKALYYDRLEKLRLLPQRIISVSRPTGTSTNVLTQAFMPADFTKGIIRHWQVHDGSWMALIGDGVFTRIINTQDERNDKFPIRFTSSVMLPFKRSMFNGIFLGNGSETGAFNDFTVPQALPGFGAAQYSVLPADW